MRELRAAALHFYVHVRAQVVVEAAQQLVAAMQDARLRAEAVEDVRELERDVAAADDEDTLRGNFSSRNASLEVMPSSTPGNPSGR